MALRKSRRRSRRWDMYAGETRKEKKEKKRNSHFHLLLRPFSSLPFPGINHGIMIKGGIFRNKKEKKEEDICQNGKRRKGCVWPQKGKFRRRGRLNRREGGGSVVKGNLSDWGHDERLCMYTKKGIKIYSPKHFWSLFSNETVQNRSSNYRSRYSVKRRLGNYDEFGLVFSFFFLFFFFHFRFVCLLLLLLFFFVCRVLLIFQKSERRKGTKWKDGCCCCCCCCYCIVPLSSSSAAAMWQFGDNYFSYFSSYSSSFFLLGTVRRVVVSMPRKG